MAGNAGETGLRFGRVDLLADGLLPAAAEEDGVIMAAGAPLTGLCRALDILHAFDGGAVELVVEAGEVMDAALPLLVDVLVAGAALFGIEEVV